MTSEASAPTDSGAASLERALEAWARVLGAERVIFDTGPYQLDTSPFTGRVPVAVRPGRVAEVQEVVRIAQRFSVPIYPISTGNNWGYGTSVPVRSPGVVVDLRSMRSILELDPELGVVTLEPGVTQGDLDRYLRDHDLPFMVPVTGAGPSCSVLANALERGFGVTPVTDHFAAVVSLRAVLPSGEIYEPFSRRHNAVGAARAFKWSTGPYLDGLFSQSNLGIVVDASIVLEPRPERRGALLFVLDSNREVEEVTTSLRTVLHAAGQGIGAVNVMNRERVECMLRGARQMDGEPGEGGRADLPRGAWFGFGSVYGSREHYRATCRLLRRSLRGRARGVRIYSSRQIERLRWVKRLATAARWSRLTGLVERLEGAIGIVEGRPSRFALPLAYAASGRVTPGREMNPAHDGCGLYWYAPIVPFRSGVVRQFLEFAERICGRHGLLAPITLTTLSPRCYASTIPLLFDRGDPEAESRAARCFEELFEEGLALGFVPYRTGAPFMADLVAHGAPFGAAIETLKRALDPNLVVAPGRYSASPCEPLPVAGPRPVCGPRESPT